VWHRLDESLANGALAGQVAAPAPGPGLPRPLAIGLPGQLPHVAADVSDLGRLRVEPVAAVRQPHDWIGRWTGMAAASALHAAALLAFALAGMPEPYGGGGQWLEAISVEVVFTPVTEAREAQRTEVAGADAPVAPEDGEASLADARPEPLKPKPDQGSEQPDQRVEVTLAQEQVPQPDADPAAPNDAATAKPDTLPEPQSRGGIAALTVGGKTHASARVTASPGAVQRYAMQVRAALARNKPSGRGTRGTATITFGISVAGRVSFAHLTGPSGNSALDKAAASAVLRTSFPVPPDGMSESQLTYVVPFHFK
jgi:TonB family protein